MAQFRFVVDGDFVDFYDGTQHVFRVRNTTQDVDWYYETAPGIKFEVDGHGYNTIPSEIEIDGVTLSANTEFDAAIVAIFPNLAGGEGGTTTLADVLAEGNSAGDLRITDLDDPASGQDAATKAFVENSFEGNLGYISYHAILSQSGTSNPVANVQKNTLPGGAIAWTRTGVGEYQGVLTGAFIENKTMIFPSSHSLFLGMAIISWVDVNTITISTSDNGNPADSIIGANGFLKFFEIRVYN